MSFQWLLAPVNKTLVEETRKAHGIHPIVAQCAINRGAKTAGEIELFLDPKLRNLTDPFLLPNMTLAVDRLCAAQQRQETVLVFGDYDVDGITSTASLAEFLGHFGWRVQSYLPDRLKEGYGLTAVAVENALKTCNPGLIVAVDCGTNAMGPIEHLKSRGIDVIVVDHHEVVSPALSAVALVNPKFSRDGCGNGFGKDLCAAGLSFKLAHALLKRARLEKWPRADAYDIKSLLDLVALGTIADLVPLQGENRILVKAGLRRISGTERPGLKALKQAAQLNGEMDTQAVSFQLAPRLNASGRLEHARESLDLLAERDWGKAVELAGRLDAHNRKRQGIEKQMVDEITAIVRTRFQPQTDYVIVEGEESWHVGVVGIVASRILREFNRPAIVIGSEGGEWRGSGRSIEGFDLSASLERCADVLVRHGGHAMAAGLTILPEKLGEFRRRLNLLAQATLTPESFHRRLGLDAEVRLAEMNTATLDALDALEPTGQGNPPAQFVIRDVRCDGPWRRMGVSQKHAKFRVTDGQTTHEVVWWSCQDAKLPDGSIDIAVTPSLNSYQGREHLQLKLLDWRVSGESA